MRYFLLILLVFAADRLTKYWAAAYLAAHGPREFNFLFTLRETYNQGIAFGLFQGIGPLIGWLTIAVVAVLVILLVSASPDERILRAGLAILIGGALGNQFDRITRGEVLDFIATPLRSGIFNVADVAIHLGIFLILLATLWPGIKKRVARSDQSFIEV